MAKLTENSNAVYEYLKANGGKVSVNELATALDKTSRSVSANVNDLVKKGLAIRVKEDVEGEEKPVAYAVLAADHADAYEALPERK